MLEKLRTLHSRNGIAVLYIMMSLALAITLIKMTTAEPMGAGVRAISSTRGDLSGQPAGSVYAEAGNVTELEINATQISQAWQGFYGNITGNITLQDSSGHVMYDWMLGQAQGEVYTSRHNSISWSGANPVNCSNHSNIVSEELAMGMGPSNSDNITATFFTHLHHPTFLVGTWAINHTQQCYTAYTYVSGASQNTAFPIVILNDEDDKIVYATLINDSTTGFNGKTHDFQLIVPEDGHTAASQQVRTPYYFWVELT